LKDRLYTFAPRNRSRRSAQTAVYRIATALLRLITPIMAFTAEEIWRHFPRVAGDPESAHIALFPAADQVGSSVGEQIESNWQSLLEFRREVLKALEEKRKEKFISGSLEAKVRIFSDYQERTDFLRQYEQLLPALFIVSQVEIVDESKGLPQKNTQFGGWRIEIVRADGAKCERCWNYSTHVGENADYPTICERCVKALDEIESQGGATGLGAAS
jgi:isoleucyl-tRNA synthetase